VRASGRNIASTLTERAKERPGSPAVISPGRRGRPEQACTFEELDRRSDILAAGLTRVGIGAGARAALMVPPSIEMFSLVFAVFKAGAVPVIADPGLGAAAVGRCLAEAAPDAFIGVPLAQAARAALGWGRATIRRIVTTGRFRMGGGWTLRDLERLGERDLPFRTPPPGATAAVLFTSGSTGPPKGVVYTHDHFLAQVEALRATYSIEPGEVDLCTFPLFALFAPALGMTAVLPDMDPTRPARADPEKIVRDLIAYRVTNFFGSPALLRNLGRHGTARGTRLPSLRRIVSAGAPVPARVVEPVARMLAESVQVYTPYGATEVLPVTSIGSDEILQGTRALTDEGRGICVGRPVPGVEVEIIHVRDGTIERWSDDLRVPAGVTGEICVRGPMVTREYLARPDATRQAKIEAEPLGGGFFHRMGDVGWRDDAGRIWFCGRKSQRVVSGRSVLFTIPCEAVFNTHPRVARSALVALRGPAGVEPGLCVELERPSSHGERGKVSAELLEIGQRHEHTRAICRIYFHRSFPVDVRHNSKIAREKLARWAESRTSWA